MEQHIYLEGTDASGKDSTADILDHRNPGVFTRSDGFFARRSHDLLSRWKESYPQLDHGGLLLAATVSDLLSLTGLEDKRYLQVSHNSIRGASFQKAFDLPFSELFDATTQLLPSSIKPVALSAEIAALQKRVRNNPQSTEFDLLVLEHPDKVESIVENIRGYCICLGGVAINTTLLVPHEVADVISHIQPGDITQQPKVPDERNAIAFSVIQNLQWYDKGYRPVVREIEESYERES